MNALLTAYVRLALRGLFLWLIAQGYLSQEMADALMVDPDMLRVVEVTASGLAWALVEAWHIADARLNSRREQ